MHYTPIAVIQNKFNLSFRKKAVYRLFHINDYICLTSKTHENY